MHHFTLRSSLVSLGMALCATTAFASEPPAAPATPAKAPAVAAALPYDEKANASEDIANALAKAKRNHTRVFIQWGANWCGWCKLLHQLANTNPDIKKELLYEYEVVRIDVGRFDKNTDLIAKYGADAKSKGLPYITVLDADGKVIVNSETGTLERKAEGEAKQEPKPEPGHDPAKVLAFLKEHQATAPGADDTLAAGLAQAKSNDKRVFLHFGAPWCGWCHRLEDWMARPEVAALLAKEFVDVKIDTDRMAGGQALLDKHSNGKSGGIPWFEFLAADGAVLATSTSSKGNIGFPGQPEEIEWFIGMVKKSAKHLTADEIAALEKSLAPKATAAAR